MCNILYCPITLSFFSKIPSILVLTFSDIGQRLLLVFNRFRQFADFQVHVLCVTALFDGIDGDDSFIWSGFPVLNILHFTCLTGLKPTP